MQLRSRPCWLILLLSLGGAAAAQDWRADRFHLFYSNDSNAAPRLDRWRTVAASGEWLFDRPGGMAGLRLGAEIIAPVYLGGGGPPDRPFAGLVRLVGRDYRQVGPMEATFGLGVSATGPQTGLAEFLDAAHSVLNGSPVAPAIIAGQVGDAVYLESRVEIAGRAALGAVHLRPFVAARSGVETLGRVGFDLGWPAPPGRARMPITGALLDDAGQGWQFTGGLDWARVAATDLIPKGGAVAPEETRLRARFSAVLPLGNARATFGLGWLSPEFDAQPEGQFIGTVSLSWSF